MKNLTANLLPWSAGALIAFGGVAIARLVAPALPAGRPQILATFSGRLLALAGIGVILFGIHRRLRSSPAGAPSASEDHPV